MKLLFDFIADKENSRILIKREFAAKKDLVWEAWTTPEILDLWWAPKPYQTKTKSMNFTIGGMWLYCMVGPENEVHWCRADYLSIEHQESYSGLDAFCDENANINTEFPRTKWNVKFEEHGENTVVNIINQFEKLEDLEQIIELGFKEGFTMAMGNLDEYFASKK
ncbi:MAG: SRPBCC family protein [Bacteroidia bacterium]